MWLLLLMEMQMCWSCQNLPLYLAMVLPLLLLGLVPAVGLYALLSDLQHQRCAPGHACHHGHHHGALLACWLLVLGVVVAVGAVLGCCEHGLFLHWMVRCIQYDLCPCHVQEEGCDGALVGVEAVSGQLQAEPTSSSACAALTFDTVT